MCFRTPATELLLLSLLLSASSISLKNVGEDGNEPTRDEEKSIEESLEETSSENEFTLESVATTEYTTIAAETQQNVSREFRPSAPLGEIKESRIGTNPFNNVHHVKFENEVEPSSYQLVIQPEQHGNFHQSFFGAVSGSPQEDTNEGTEQQTYVKYQNEPMDVPRFYYGTVLKDQPIHQQFVHSIAENAETQQNPIDQQVFQNLEKPVYEQDTSTIFGKPSKFHGESHKHELGSFTGADYSRLPYYGGFYGHQSHQPVFHDFGTLKKTNNGIVYAQESTFMRTRKFPYSFYQPTVGYHQIEFVNDDQPVYPVRRRVSPWKKILHLIGTFLPFGLLLAALTPNIVKVNNASEPNIVLSKLRVVDLPVEHKQARFVGESADVCEERSICELILAGGRASPSVLQNLLWNLATRTSVTVAKENGLEDVFEAVKKKDCTKVDC